jgi:hypothetical protein
MITTSDKAPVESLLREYGYNPFGQGRAKILLRIDDRGPDDVCPTFCSIHLTLESVDAREFELRLDNVPCDADVEALAGEFGATWRTTRTGKMLTLSIAINDTPVLRRLARAIRDVVKRGKHYWDSNLRWIAPRTAKSLERLAAILSR